jgi:hypothetical protein
LKRSSTGIERATSVDREGVGVRDCLVNFPNFGIFVEKSAHFCAVTQIFSEILCFSVSQGFGDLINLQKFRKKLEKI